MDGRPWKRHLPIRLTIVATRGFDSPERWKDGKRTDAPKNSGGGGNSVAVGQAWAPISAAAAYFGADGT